MALSALHAHVSAGERERRLGMVERRRHPCRRGVAYIAGLWNSRRRMVRIRSRLIVLQMAADAYR